MPEPGTWELLLLNLKQPEYLHVLLHPLPIYGVALGALALLIALFMRSRPAQIPALAIVFICAISAWPLEKLGEQGEDRIESLADDPGAQWLEAHKERGEKVLPFFFALAAAALAGLLLPVAFPKSATPLAILVIILAIGGATAGSWVAHAGGKIRHKEFRIGPPPQHSAKDE